MCSLYASHWLQILWLNFYVIVNYFIPDGIIEKILQAASVQRKKKENLISKSGPHPEKTTWPSPLHHRRWFRKSCFVFSPRAWGDVIPKVSSGQGGLNQDRVCVLLDRQSCPYFMT